MFLEWDGFSSSWLLSMPRPWGLELSASHTNTNQFPTSKLFVPIYLLFVPTYHFLQMNYVVVVLLIVSDIYVMMYCWVWFLYKWNTIRFCFLNMIHFSFLGYIMQSQWDRNVLQLYLIFFIRVWLAARLTVPTYSEPTLFEPVQ